MHELLLLAANIAMLAFLILLVVIIILAVVALIQGEADKRSAKRIDFLQKFYEDEFK